MIRVLRHLWSRVAFAAALGGFSTLSGLPRASAAMPPTITDLKVGFADNYKIGSWAPVSVEIVGGTDAAVGIVVITAPDGDGVPTSVTSSPQRPVSIDSGKKTTERLFVRMGQQYGEFRVQLVSPEGKTLASRVFPSAPIATGGAVAAGLPATNRLVVEFGPSLGLGDLVTSEGQNDLTRTRLSRVESAADLPTAWYGYEGVDMVVLTTSRADLYRPLAQNGVRVEALRHWVEMGGELVIVCGSQADELYAEGGALADLLPGKFKESLALEQSQAIESFSGSEQSITPTRRVDFHVPTFAEIRGTVLASAKRGQTELPLVIRGVLGFGEVTLVGLDFDQPPLADWPGRRGFLAKSLQWNTEGSTKAQNPGVAEVNSDDLVSQIRTTLDESFMGVNVVPFALVAVLVAGYILLIGPADYFLVNKLLKRPEATWVSFPLVVVGVSTAAYFFANWQKGDQLRVNQVEIVDIDTMSGHARGTVWTHFFTPRVNKFDLTIEPAFLKQKPIPDNERIVAWLGQPGYGLGGMQGGTQSSMFDQGYAFDPKLDAMLGVPVQLWSTKTITARWSAEVASPIETTLAKTDDQLLLGQITNNSDETLEDCVLLYGQWAWNLGTLAAGSGLNIADAKQPRTVRTLLTNATAGDTTVTETAEDGTVPYRLGSSDITRLAKAMMFFRAINGERYSGMLSRYQSFLDMSHLLDQPEVAILLTKAHTVGTHGSQWFDGDKPLKSNQDLNWTYYRFVVHVGPQVESEN